MKDSHRQVSIRVVGIATAIAPRRRPEVRNCGELHEPAGPFQVRQELVALAIDVRRNVVRGQAGGGTTPYPAVIGGGANPDRPAVGRHSLRTPEADVMALARTPC